jgi:hypothetical protein
VLANILFWVDATIFNTDRFASAVDHTMAKPEVQDRLATVISQEVAAQVDVQQQLEGRLPDDLKFVAAFAGNEIEETVLYRASQRLLSSGFTAGLRQEIVERAHRRLMRPWNPTTRRCGLRATSSSWTCAQSSTRSSTASRCRRAFSRPRRRAAASSPLPRTHRVSRRRHSSSAIGRLLHPGAAGGRSMPGPEPP